MFAQRYTITMAKVENKLYKYTIMSKYSGKEERINGVWYPVSVEAESIKHANKKLYVGQRKSYGTVEAIRGRWMLDE